MPELKREGDKKRHSAVRSRAVRSPRRGGRVTEARRQEIVKIVSRLFLERGYEQVTIDDIVARIGGSKRTLYERFGGKSELFELVVKEYCAAVHHDIAKDVVRHASAERQLISFGTHFLNMILDPRILEMHRLMVSMGRSFPALSQMFFKVGPQRIYDLIADWIREQQALGKLSPGNAPILAELFLNMVTGKHQLALLTSSFDATSPLKIKRTVAAAAHLFLNGAGSRGRARIAQESLLRLPRRSRLVRPSNKITNTKRTVGRPARARGRSGYHHNDPS